MRKIKTGDTLKRGTAELLLLTLLLEEDMYGYQLSQLIKERSNYSVSFPEGSLYPALYKLCDEKYISCYEKQVGKRLRRVYYHIEKIGIAYQREIAAEFQSLYNGIISVLYYSKETK